MPRPSDRPRRPARWFMFAAALGAGAAVAAATSGPARRALAIDRCLDAGGQWIEARGVCEGARPGG